MAVERSGPYIWVTWLTKLMAGENQCEWASWFRAHYKWDKLPSDFDVAKWTTEHNTLVHERRKQLEAEGLTVYAEDQNSFRVEGKTGIVVSGKADIVAITEDAAFVEDCKTGNPKNSDHMQVMIYLLMLPVAVDHCKGRSVEGRIIYKDSTIDVPSSKIDGFNYENSNGRDEQTALAGMLNPIVGSLNVKILTCLYPLYFEFPVLIVVS